MPWLNPSCPPDPPLFAPLPHARARRRCCRHTVVVGAAHRPPGTIGECPGAPPACPASPTRINSSSEQPPRLDRRLLLPRSSPLLFIDPSPLQLLSHQRASVCLRGELLVRFPLFSGSIRSVCGRPVSFVHHGKSSVFAYVHAAAPLKLMRVADAFYRCLPLLAPSRRARARWPLATTGCARLRVRACPHPLPPGACSQPPRPQAPGLCYSVAAVVMLLVTVADAS